MELHPPGAVSASRVGAPLRDGAAAEVLDESPRAPARAKGETWLDALPGPDAARLRMRARADNASPRMALYHRLLGGRATDPPALGSVSARLKMALGPVPDGIVAEDRDGTGRLMTTPPLRRAVMIPQKLARNPLARAWQRLRDRLGGRRGHLATAASIDPLPVGPDGAGKWHRAASIRRVVLTFLTLAQAAFSTYGMSFVLPYHGRHFLEMAILVIFAILSAWVSAGFWTAMMGFLVLLRGGDRHSISSMVANDAPIASDARTAILIPVCNETVSRVFAGLRATYESLARTGQLQRFDFFVLSDSSDPDTRVAELQAWAAFCRELGAFGRMHYRRRALRLRRKSGNIADWCRRWGSSYRYMVVFDADSVMSGACLVRLVQLMEATPGCGIIQTAPRTTGRETPYARIQQFAHGMYGPLFTAGLHFWQLGESHYWGHNAIIRVAPFIRHCALAKLPGRGPLGGEILSHDFVEAALMRRAGWTVWLAYDLPGSWEEMPPTLLDELKRDRRWCIGNLQHFRLFMAQGLHPAHRALFMTGMMAYVSAPLWFLFLALSTTMLGIHVLVPPKYFTEPGQLFPDWPEWHPNWAIMLFVATAALLLLPKLLAIVLRLIKGSKGYGGPAALIISGLAEQIFSALLAPVRMIAHTEFVLGALLGLNIRWQSPPREDAETTWREALQRHGAATFLGVTWTAFAYWLNPTFLWWLLPVAGSLIVSVPASVYSSRLGLGRYLRRERLFLIPEETRPVRELRRLRATVKRSPAWADGFRRACVDPLVNALVAAHGRIRVRLPDAARVARRALAYAALEDGPDSLNAVDRNVLLTDPEALSRLHYLLWSQSIAHAGWGV